MRKLSDHLPDFLKSVEDFRQITNAQQAEFDELFKQRYRHQDNQFLLSADEYGLKRYERLFGLEKNATLPNEERRFALKTLMIERRPTTINFLKSQLKILCGENGYEITREYQNLSINVRLALEKKSNVDAVKELISKIIPANMTFTVDLLYNTHGMFFGRKNGEISPQTHGEIREEPL